MKLFKLILIFNLCLLFQVESLPNFSGNFDIPVRVLIKEIDSNIADFTFESKDGFLVTDSRVNNKKRYFSNSKLVVNIQDNKVTINSKFYGYAPLYIVPKNKSFGTKINDKFYDGIFVLTNDLEGKIFLVNHVDLEDYLAAVVTSESWPGWPAEVNKMQVIISRTYCMLRLLERKKLVSAGKKVLPYDINSSNKHQVYGGFSKDHLKFLEKAISVVNSTKGLVLCYGGQIIDAMFDTCCGGIIPAKKDGINFQTAPYLKRGYVCNHCKPYKYYSWETSLPVKDFEKSIAEHFPNIKKIKDIKVTMKDAAGFVKEIKVKSGSSWVYIPYKKFKLYVKGLKSKCFSLEKRADFIIIKGRGHGHCIGVCQWGAKNLIVNENYTYRQALKFYYPGTNLMRLVKSR